MFIQGLHRAAQGWRDDPIKMIAKVTASFIVGQGVFWLVGYDQLGLGMRPKKQFGLGQKVARWATNSLCHDTETAVALKIVEIMTDLAKAPLEAACYHRHGLTPDAVSCLATQPLWSTAEAAEKAISALAYPHRLIEPEQIGLSAACIYGSLFRCGQAALLLAFGAQVNRAISEPIEKTLKRLLGMR